MNELLVSALTGLSIGFLGSFHCIGMCGPIALTLPVREQQGFKKYAGIFLYNLGRAVTYTLLGLILGYLGSRFRLWGMQQAVSILAGAFILFFVFSNLNLGVQFKWMQPAHAWVQKHLARLLVLSRRPRYLFPIGMLNGLLPCGLVYVAVAAAIATTHTGQAAIVMFSFGIGTIPVMAGLMLFGHLISVRWRQKINRAVPYVVGVMAILLILRGLNLGIPFISPKMMHNADQIESCH